MSPSRMGKCAALPKSFQAHRMSEVTGGSSVSRGPVSCALFVDVCVIRDTRCHLLGIGSAGAGLAWTHGVRQGLGVGAAKPPGPANAVHGLSERERVLDGVQCRCRCCDLEDGMVQWKVVIMFTLPRWYWTPRETLDIELISPSTFVNLKALN